MTKKESLLNEKGEQLVDLKRVLVQHRNNVLVYDGLRSSIKPSEYDPVVFKALIDAETDDKMFESILLSLDGYANKEQVNKVFVEFANRLSVSLEKKGLKLYQTEVAPAEGVVKIVRKYGVGLAELQRKFRLHAEEAQELITNGFAEQYARLKMNAAFKDLVPMVESDLGNLNITVSDFYFDTPKKFFNRDIIVKVFITSQHANAASITVSSTADKIIKALKLTEDIILKGKYLES